MPCLWVLEMRINIYQDRQQEKPVSHCSHCMSEIYEEDECYLIGGQVICSSCLEDFEKETMTSMTGHDLNNYFNHLFGGLDDID